MSYDQWGLDLDDVSARRDKRFITNTSPAKLVYIAGSGHSGSTLLNLILDGHTRISALSEVHRLWNCAHRTDRRYWCGCGRPVVECPFWTDVANELRTMLDSKESNVLASVVTTDPRRLHEDVNTARHSGYRYEVPFNPTINRLLMIVGSKRLWTLGSHLSNDVSINRSAIENSLFVFEAVRRAAGTPVIVDATKNPARMKGLYLAQSGGYRVLQIIRDGRAVCNSRMRREGASMEEAAKLWVADQRKQKLALLTISSAKISAVRYEDLATDAESEIRRVCNHMGVAFENQMLDFRQHEHHDIGGNAMRFRKTEREISLDERWRREIRAGDLRTFEKIAGRLNRKFGYY